MNEDETNGAEEQQEQQTKTKAKKKAAPAQKAAAKKAAPAKKAAAKKAPAEKAKKAAKEEKEPVDRAAAISRSWADPDVAASRSAKHRVKVGGVEFRSVLQAFKELGLPVKMHIAFRKQLKTEGKLQFVNPEDGKKCTFALVPASE